MHSDQTRKDGGMDSELPSFLVWSLCIKCLVHHEVYSVSWSCFLSFLCNPYIPFQISEIFYLLVIYSIPVTRDFIGGSRSVMLESSTSTVCVDVDIIDDAVPEVSQHFEILFDPLLVLPKLRFDRTQRAEVTILDNDGKYTSWDIFIIGILCVYMLQYIQEDMFLYS